MQKLLKVFFVQLILFYVCTFSRKIGRSVKLTHRDKLMIVNYHNDIRRLIYASNMQALVSFIFNIYFLLIQFKLSYIRFANPSGSHEITPDLFFFFICFYCFLRGFVLFSHQFWRLLIVFISFTCMLFCFIAIA